MDKEVTCPDCGTVSEQSELILKLGGALCPDCRYIIYPPHDPEYRYIVKCTEEEEDETTS